MSKVREMLAAYAHEAWSGWMNYLFDKSIHNSDGTVTIPKWAVDRWKRQAYTPYKELPEEEKKSDLAEADKMLKIVDDSGYRQEIFKSGFERGTQEAGPANRRM